MQDLLLELFPYLAAFYLLDAIGNLKPYALALCADWGRFTLETAGLRLLGLWPASEVVASHATPLLFTADGFYLPDPGAPRLARVPLADELRYVGFDELGELEVIGKKLRRNERLLWRAPTQQHAKQLSRLLRALAKAAPNERMAQAEKWQREATDLSALRELRRRQSVVRRLMRALSVLLAGALFVALPLVLYVPQARPLPLAPLAGLIAILILELSLLAFLFVRRGGASASEALGGAAMILLLPFAAAHPLVHLSRELYARFHWGALAAVMLPREEFHVLARQELRRVALAKERADASLQPHWKLQESLWRRLLEQLGEPVAAVLAPPSPADCTSTRYCPLCSSQYRADAPADCGDCGVPLEDLGSVATTPRRGAAA